VLQGTAIDDYVADICKGLPEETLLLVTGRCPLSLDTVHNSLFARQYNVAGSDRGTLLVA
jgi:hypothetical protein